jgi:hypothetical protein
MTAAHHQFINDGRPQTMSAAHDSSNERQNVNERWEQRKTMDDSSGTRPNLGDGNGAGMTQTLAAAHDRPRMNPAAHNSQQKM